MKLLHVERSPVTKGLTGTVPSDSDFSTLVSGSARIFEGGELKIVYLELDSDCSELVGALKRIKALNTERTNGLRSTSRTFGFSTRNIIRGDFCSAVSLAQERPGDHALVCSYAETVGRLYREHNPGLFRSHHEKSEGRVAADYRIGSSPFTSGNINKNNSLAYHFDRGNFPGVWSCCLVFKGDCRGGHLSCPEYKIGLDCRHNSLVMFDGQRLLHGVTPVQAEGPEPFRISVVYYSLEQMWHCLAGDAELDRIRDKKTEREVAFAGRKAYAGAKVEIRRWLKGGH